MGSVPQNHQNGGMGMKPMTARVTPLCAVETCQRPLPRRGLTFFARIEATLQPVCRDCAATRGRVGRPSRPTARLRREAEYRAFLAMLKKKCEVSK